MSSSTLIEALETQTRWCDRLGSPFTARVIDILADDWRAGGPLRELLPDWPGDPVADAVPLRLAGALHALVLGCRDDALAAVWPPAPPNPARLRAALTAALAHHRVHIGDYLRNAPQTNEVGRSAALLGGFAHVAARFRLPLATLEIGASAGLNLHWHRYRYELGALRWGDAASPVTVRSDWQGAAPALPLQFAVAHQAACDVAPIDLAAPDSALRLMSYVWADQRDRLARLAAAIELARRHPVTVERADAAAWVERQLARPRPGVATALVHTIVWQYLGDAARQRIRAALAEAGARATEDAPLAWLRLEPSSTGEPELRLTCWPGGERRVLACAHPHGQHVRWC